ncbi:hypothetical protein TGAM01_v210027 [Trichoderma gamsii]|uniref:Uncharacterized protein n=1 Tax=Trichoderma gamsii TaxID=398673 RepID=A0A0W7VFS3_9HYPO|nr:hypothetical protein TGAM01_v210027 [Trichoderma gamsii]PNP37917.1 hypothetical protein TGAMA5MH_10016 [Trichoderma gamsii]PON21071.1 hypothetical protein TGAM01_v210027 [Trichoderma gamsii]
MSSQQNKSVASSRFELLPALNLNFGSITDGTDIPPPPESPIEPTITPARTPKTSDGNISGKQAIPATVAAQEKADTTIPEDAPPSPAISGQQGSAFQDNNGRNIVNVYRPQSQSGSSVADSEKKRASGWFKRLRTGENQSRRRSSLLSLEQQPHLSTNTITPKPPSDNKPPPKIPKLVHLESDNGDFGSNLFDDIK